MYENFYKSLYRIRRVEEEIAKVYSSDKIKSPVHLSIGQEAVSVGVCEALQPHDVAFGTYRSHALYLAKGGDMKEMIAEKLNQRLKTDVVRNIFFVVGRINAQMIEMESQSPAPPSVAGPDSRPNEEFLESIGDHEIRQAFKRLLRGYSRRQRKD